MGGFDDGGCDGCGEEDTKHQRHFWQMCADCLKDYERRKKAAKEDLLMAAYMPNAHLWRVSGAVMGDSGPDSMNDYTIKRPILVEHPCRWCAIHKALISYDPWAFAYILADHGELADHDEKDSKDYQVWIKADLNGVPSLLVEDLGVIGEDRWARRFGRPQLPVKAGK